ncbi:DUF5658 family protein [Halegenticoccus soli]|uniref:DUF5658 family protein n=1 Tax=Halegenticoccus soli TaxID=1985678 RepID=UPI000C6E2642|nr:DUF5658 family protein [Halegenticoccus soli]
MAATEGTAATCLRELARGVACAVRNRSTSSLDSVDRVETYLWAAVLSLFWLDIGLTVVGLRRGFAEANPVAVAAISAFGPVVGLAGLKGAALSVGVLGWLIVPVRYQRLIPALLSLPWIVAVCVNAAVLGGLL